MNDDAQLLDRIAVPCGRLSCRQPVIQEVGPGRRKEFCSDTCRRGADREYKRARTHVSTYSEVLRRAQHEVASYGRKAEEGVLTPDDVAHLEAQARIAFTRAATLVEVGVPEASAAAELRSLVEALGPLLTGGVGFAARTA
ncbi:hypothetical protein [Nocardioides stalactiti]|uniref:hypothetical protein n=1 Tax=Nocardioides stalactiti TaxID=2755356 RepID=UPI0016040DE0|nr:hypothetical protein [Nocardioides stalactiti]